MPVEIAICNTAGQIVREFKPGIQAAGRHSFVWQTSGDQAQPSGLYYVRISTPYQEAVGKVLLLK
jgi:flagellar hook assembly protein FlgD